MLRKSRKFPISDKCTPSWWETFAGLFQRYSFIQLSELWQRGVIKLAKDIDCSHNPCNANYTQCVDTDEGYECRCKSCDCSSVRRSDNCTLDATLECLFSKATTEFSRYDEFYLSHPYNCDWYIWCFSRGTQGVSMKCAPPTHFNPNYNRDRDRPCVNNKHCKETW
ncbi:hypothetical protein LSAT2_029254 [Lamellibrachia satsuma]|nr:hypothetical protein LSAT2_029254 [Lamellibrachia satsuma]